MKMYDPQPDAFYCDEETLTEQEHKDSCDINKMIHAALRGQNIRGATSEPVYGYDDTTMDGLTHRINKQQLEESLYQMALTTELTEEAIKKLPPHIQQKFGFRAHKPKTNEPNEQKPMAPPTPEISKPI